jgi:hypothetical protein
MVKYRVVTAKDGGYTPEEKRWDPFLGIHLWCSLTGLTYPSIVAATEVIDRHKQAGKVVWESE